MILNINNGRQLEVYQDRVEDGPVCVATIDNKGLGEGIYFIKPEDFVTMLNWYSYQKAHGNENLTF